MKTAATHARPLLLILGAFAVVGAVALNAQSRSESPAAAANEPHPTQSVAIAAPETAPAAAASDVTVPAAAAPSAAPGEAGMKAYLDPEGGLTHVPPQGTVEPLASQPVRPERLPEVVLPDGSVMVDLQGHFEEYTVVTIDADGNRVVTCSQHGIALSGPAPSAPVQREDR